MASDAAAVVQAQLDAYNAHDVDALIACYARDAMHFEHPSTRIAEGEADLRARFEARFRDPAVHADLVHRVELGTLVVDHEKVTRHEEGRLTRRDLVATYEVLDGRIRRAWFAWGPATPA